MYMEIRERLKKLSMIEIAYFIDNLLNTIHDHSKWEVSKKEPIKTTTVYLTKT